MKARLILVGLAVLSLLAEVAEERNRARGDRFAGLARALTATVHRDARYQFEIDTTTQTPDEAVSQLTHRLGY